QDKEKFSSLYTPVSLTAQEQTLPISAATGESFPGSQIVFVELCLVPKPDERHGTVISNTLAVLLEAGSDWTPGCFSSLAPFPLQLDSKPLAYVEALLPGAEVSGCRRPRADSPGEGADDRRAAGARSQEEAPPGLGIGQGVRDEGGRPRQVHRAVLLETGAAE